MRRIGLMIILALLMAACAPSTETATHTENASKSGVDDAIQTVEDMLAAAQSGDWERYVDFYGEQHKFGSPADRAALVARFRDKWGSEVVERLQMVKGVAPRIEGSRAIFEKDGEALIVLHADDDGRWTFHL